MEKMGLIVFNNFFYKKKILITGCTGFKGTWLTLWLNTLGAKTFGIALNDKSKNSVFKKVNSSTKIYYEDVRNLNKIKKIIKKINPDIIFHFAAQSLVIKSYKDPILTWETNVIGTLNILESSKIADNLKTIIVATSDKCYSVNNKSKTKKFYFSENSGLGGEDPYSASKAGQELAVKSFRNSSSNLKFNIVTIRAGNVIGGGDWSENRIIPDLFRAFKTNKKIFIRNPDQIRPWQYVLDCIQGYLLVCYKVSQSNIKIKSINIGPPKKEIYTVKKIINLFKKSVSVKSKIQPSSIYKETNTLLLDSSLANKKFKFKSVLNIFDTVKFTSDWYLNDIKNKELIYAKQLNLYLSIAKEKKLSWIK